VVCCQLQRNLPAGCSVSHDQYAPGRKLARGLVVLRRQLGDFLRQRTHFPRSDAPGHLRWHKWARKTSSFSWMPVGDPYAII
jgi:hypothetical protein